MKCIFCMMVLLCLQLKGFGQGLKPGDVMPDVQIKGLNNYPTKTVRFSNFQKELTIIDFWATWCGSCIESFGKLHGLRSKYADKLELLMVNSEKEDDKTKINAFLKRRENRTGMAFTLPYLLQDSIFQNLFPYKIIPHCIWVNKNGKIIAITEGSEVTEENIRAVLKGEMVNLNYKNDALLFDPARDEILPNNDSSNERLLYRSIITAEKIGAGSTIFYEAAGKGLTKRVRILNTTLITLYQNGYKDVFKYSLNRLVIDPDVASLFERDKDEKKRRRYCYEMQTASVPQKKAMQWLAADLERCFNATAVAEERITDCYVIKAGRGVQSFISKSKAASSDLNDESLRMHITHGSINDLRSFLERVLKQPVIDETACNLPIDINFPKGFTNYDSKQIQSFLKMYGIDLEKTSRLLWVPRLKAINQN